MREIEYFYVSRASHIPDGFATQIDKTSLQGLVCDDPAFSDADLDRLGKIPNLTRLSLALTSCTGANLENTLSLKHLDVLNLFGSAATDDGLLNSGSFSVETVSLDGTGVQGRCLRRFAESKNIRLANSKVCDAGLQTPVEFSSLEWLDLSGCAVSGAGLKNLKFPTDHLSKQNHGPTMTLSIDLSGTLVTDDDLAIVAQWENLERLNISNTKINGSGLKHLAKLTWLYKLDLSGTKITQASLETLRSFPRLGDLDVDPPLVDRAHEILQARNPTVDESN